MAWMPTGSAVTTSAERWGSALGVGPGVAEGQVDLERHAEVDRARHGVDHQLGRRIVLEVAPDERDAIVELTVSTMRGAYEMRVPLEVNVALGATWAAAKG